MAAADHMSRHVFIRGRVQGVGFRAWVEDEAARRGLKGFVRNRRDGSVEALFSGPAEEVLDMIAACRRGPPAARVTAVDESDPDSRLAGEARSKHAFVVLPTV